MSDHDAATSSDRQSKLEKVLAQYLHSVECGQPLDRVTLIAAHPDLAADLQSFFQNHDAMQTPAEPIQAADQATILTDFGSDAIHPSAIVRYFGNYELMEEIARGAMGVVFKARQVNLNRIVALKMILAGQFANDEQVKRFQAEAEAAAKLDHPGIVPIFEIGQHDGQHYFSMGYVEGQDLARKVSAVAMPMRDAAGLIKTVAEAVQYAHRQGIIHRDLKPANVLIDLSGHPRITDFGLAKVLQVDSELTGTGHVLGTPSYMPPEQASAKVEQIGPASDIYSLGAILYQLLTGRPPFQGSTAIDTLRQVVETEPVAVRQLNAQVPIDLETICMKCLQKEPRQRYSTAQSMADELQRWLEGRPILARPTGPMEHLARWGRRNPIIAGLLVSTIASLFLIAVISFVGYLTTSRALDAADARAYGNQIMLAARDLETGRRNQAVWALRTTSERRRGWEWRHLMRKCYPKMRELSHHQRLEICFTSTSVRAIRQDGTIVGLDGSTISQIPDFELFSFSSPSAFDVAQWGPQSERITVSADRRAYLGRDPKDPLQIKVGDVVAGTIIGQFQLPATGCKALALTEDHERVVAVFQNGPELSWHVWNVATGERIATYSHDWARFERLDDSGRRIAFRQPDGLTEMLIICDTSSGDRLQSLSAADVTLLGFASTDPLIRRGAQFSLWTNSAEKPLINSNNTELTHAVVSQDNELLVTATSQNRRMPIEETFVDVWRRSSLKRVMRIPVSLTVTQLAVSPNNRWLAIAVQDRLMGGAMSIALWDLSDGRIETVLKPEYDNENRSSQNGSLSQIVFSPDNTTVAAHENTRFYHDSESWYVWPVPDDGPDSVRPLSAIASRVAFSEDGGLLAVAIGSGSEIQAFGIQDQKLVTLDPDAADVASAKRHLEDRPTVKFQYGSNVEPNRFRAPVGSIEFVYHSPTVVPMIGITDKGKLEIRNSSDRLLHRLEGHVGVVTAATFSRDGRFLATASTDESITSGRTSLFTTRTVDWEADKFQQSAEIKIWDVSRGTSLQTMRGHSGMISDLAFSPDAKRLASAGVPRTGVGIDQSLGGQLIVWDVQSGQQLLLFSGSQSGFNCVEFSPDGNLLVAAGDAVYLWNGQALPKPAAPKPATGGSIVDEEHPEYPLDSVSVEVYPKELTPERCERLRKMSNLERIDIVPQPFEIPTFEAGPVSFVMPSIVPPVKQLSLLVDIDPRTIEVISRWEGLEFLNMSWNHNQMTADSLRPLLMCKNLKTIHISNAPAIPLTVLGSHPSLKSATLKGDSIGPCLAFWKDLQLESLDLDSTDLKSDAMQSIAAMTALQTLRIQAGGLHKPDLSFLRELTQLKSLDLWFWDMDQPAISNAVALHNLKSLTIRTHEARLSYDDLVALSFPPQLEEVVLEMEFTDRERQRLGKTVILKALSQKCPNARITFAAMKW